MKNNLTLVDAFKTLWPVALVLVSVVAQWAVLGQRLTNVEERQDRQEVILTTQDNRITDTQNNYAALNSKVDSLGDNVLYIRNRIDNALSNNK